MSTISFLLRHKDELLGAYKQLKEQKKKKKKKRRKIILTVSILSVVLITSFLLSALLPVYLFSSTIAAFDTLEFLPTDDNSYDNLNNIGGITGGTNNTGEAVELSGGLTAMGVNFEETLTNLQEQYDTTRDQTEQKTLAGKIAYVQLYQLMDSMTEITGHPIMLLGVGMGIREMSTFNVTYKSFAEKMMQGDATDFKLGIYGTWCKKNINGLANNGGGVISHTSDCSADSSIVKQATTNSETKLPAKTFADLTNGKQIKLDIGQTYSSVISWSSTKNCYTAATYNKGAYGPLQIEGNHWVTWVCPYVSSTVSSKYVQYLGQAYVNIPIDNTTYDSLGSSLKNSLPGYARSIVTYNNSYLSIYRQNKDFVDTVMSTVGHSNYVNDYINLLKTSETALSVFDRGKGYYFVDRFKDSSKVWDDWTMSLESWPHAYTLLACNMIGRNCMYENTAQIKSSSGKVTADNYFESVISNNYGSDFTFVNKTASDIYWALEMYQSWNYGSPCAAYSSAYVKDMAYFYREVANYIATYGTAAIREQHENWQDNCDISSASCNCGASSGLHKPSTYAGGSGKCEVSSINLYVNLLNLVTEGNGTRYNTDGSETETYKKIKSALDTNKNRDKHKTSFGYAMTALLDAEKYAQKNIKDLFGIDNFNIFNYGGLLGTAGTIGGTISLDNYDFTQDVPQSTPVSDSYFSDTIFIGDSLTVGFSNNSGCSAAGFFGKVGWTTTAAMNTKITEADSNVTSTMTTAINNSNGTGITIMEAVKNSSFNKVYIMYGINEINSNLDSFKNNYERIIDTVRAVNPNAVIYIQSILPIDTSKQYGANISNETVLVKNNLLRQLAQHEKCLFVNVSEIMYNTDGTLKTDYYVSDGLHLKSSTYSYWYSYLKTHAVTETVSQGEQVNEE